MNIGMLWFDDDKHRTLADKVERAVEYYRTKYGAAPTTCFVNPATLDGGPERVAGVRLLPAKTVLVHHFWLGVATATEYEWSA